MPVIKGQSLRCSPGWGNLGLCIRALYVGEGSKREQCCLLCSLPIFSHFPCYPQANGALLVLIPGGWVCVCSRPLWVSPTNSTVRLGVSSAAASTPTGVFSHRFEALFPCTGALGLRGVSLPSCSSWFICTQMWDRPLCQPPPCHKSSLPGCPARPSYRSG